MYKEDNAFIVEVTELPGCMADGETVADAIANYVALSSGMRLCRYRGFSLRYKAFKACPMCRSSCNL